MLHKILFAGILVLAFLFRFVNLATIPIHLSHDEVGIGYSAWSVLQTGKDEYGNKNPTLFRSFDDYKLPGYIYSVSFFESFLGLSALSVRLPSAILGFLTVVATYFLVKEFLENKKGNQKIALFSMFVMATSPWHINFSRAGFETNGSVFFIVLAIFFLLKARNKPYFYILSSIAVVVSLYFYYTARILLPIVILVFAVIYFKNLLKDKKWVIISVLVGVLLVSPLIIPMFTNGLSRLNQVSIFNDVSIIEKYTTLIAENNNSPLLRFFYNRRFAFAHQFADGYFKNLDFDYIFTNGTGPLGLLHLWEFPFLMVGLFTLSHQKSKSKFIAYAWLLAVPIVGGFSLHQPNPLRTLPMAPILVLFTSFGVFFVFEKIKNYKKLAIVGLSLVIFFSLARFTVIYFDYQYKTSARNWGDGHRQMVAYVNSVKNHYDTIYISGYNWRPYIFYLFYSQYDPKKFQTNPDIFHIDNLKFGIADWDRIPGINLGKDYLTSFPKNEKTLFILTDNDYKKQEEVLEGSEYAIKVIKEINGAYLEKPFIAVELVKKLSGNVPNSQKIYN